MCSFIISLMAIAFDLGTAAAKEASQRRESHGWENSGFGGFRKSMSPPSLLAACSCVDGTNIDSSGYA